MIEVYHIVGNGIVVRVVDVDTVICVAIDGVVDESVVLVVIFQIYAAISVVIDRVVRYSVALQIIAEP